jgi:hypothetical protein
MRPNVSCPFWPGSRRRAEAAPSLRPRLATAGLADRQELCADSAQTPSPKEKLLTDVFGKSYCAAALHREHGMTAEDIAACFGVGPPAPQARRGFYVRAALSSSD